MADAGRFLGTDKSIVPESGSLPPPAVCRTLQRLLRQAAHRRRNLDFASGCGEVYNKAAQGVAARRPTGVDSSTILIDEGESLWYTNELWPRYRKNVGKFDRFGSDAAPFG